MNIERQEVTQKDQVRIPTLDCAWAHQCGQIPLRRCCLSYRRMVTGIESPFPPAACRPSLGSHPPSSPPTRIPPGSGSATLQQQGSSWQHHPAVPWLDTNRLRILARNTKVAATARKSKYQGPVWHSCLGWYATLFVRLQKWVNLCMIEQPILQHLDLHWEHRYIVCSFQKKSNITEHSKTAGYQSSRRME